MARFLPVLEHEREENNYLRRIKRRMREENDPFNLRDDRFMELFRFNKATMRELIELLEPHLILGARVHKTSKQHRILAAIRFFASGSYQRCVGQDCFVNLSQSQISLAITEVAAAIENRLGDFIAFPNPEEYAAIKTTFMERYNVPGVIGFVDGTHIAITKPTLNIEHQYLNRKGFHSKNVQIVCGPNNKIFGINAAHGGATHDAFIWRQSNIARILEQRFTGGDRTSWLLGDSGYPLQPYVITPVRNPADGTPEHRFNIAHRRARSCVERCIGVLKARFRCLIQERVLKYAPVKAGSIINACAILHNFMVARNVPLPPEHEILEHMDDPGDNDDDDLVPEQPPNEARMINVALETRARLIRQHFN
ncbi:hypothetical protein Zmor_021236 [Zophobas morio]|uniref:DDE Tnp4 domain-containing protein n=1 Tax=Zophobas morio TaxID=2755281 RepID=A0AA38I757_9CUCU|nr:hypothetical protein Zmor_021236 [Zophobas morio]